MGGSDTRSIQTSIIVVTFNNRHEIDTCLRSLETHSMDAEVIVVDNQSTDGTLEHVRRHYPYVHTMAAERNSGFGAGVNLGARLARGAFLAVLNPDTAVEPGWLEPLIDILKRRPDVGLATPTILLTGTDNLVNACGNDVHLTGLAFCSKLNEPAPHIGAPARPVSAISGAAFAIRKSLWVRLSGFDERFFMYLEDTDLSLRARREGYAIMHVPASRIWHTYKVNVSAGKLYHLEHNRLLMLRKNFSPVTLALLTPALLLTEAITWAFCMRSGTTYLRAKWRSYYDTRHMPCANTSGTTPSHQSDYLLLHALGTRMALEQLQSGRGVTTVNTLLAAFYTLCRAMALVAIVGRRRLQH